MSHGQFQGRYLVSEVLDVLSSNRAKHIEKFKAAVGIYKKEAEKRLLRMLKTIRAGKRISHVIALPAPVNYASEYDRLILLFTKMLDKEVTLDEQQFNSIYCDRWSWQLMFYNNTLGYLGATGCTGSTGPTGLTGPIGGTSTMGYAGEEASEGESEGMLGEDLVPASLG